MSWLLLALACSNGPTYEEALAAKKAEATPIAHEAPQEEAVQVPWDNDFALAAGVGEVFKKSLIEGTPVTVEHQGSTLELRPGNVLLKDGKPQSYPGSATTGWVLVEAPLASGEGKAQLVMSVEWVSAATDLGGRFTVTDTQIHRLGETQYFTFEKDGDFWVRKPSS